MALERGSVGLDTAVPLVVRESSRRHGAAVRKRRSRDARLANVELNHRRVEGQIRGHADYTTDTSLVNYFRRFCIFVPAN